MDFRTVIKPLDKVGLLNHSTPMLLIGSCFSDNIGARLKQRLFPVMVNPFGTIYNPESIHAVVQRIIYDKEFCSDELFLHQNLYRHFLCHSSLSGVDIQSTLSVMNKQLHDAHNFIKTTSAIFLTFGTAWIYKFNATDSIVANCHKLPANEFTRSLLSVDAAANAITNTLTEIRNINPDAKLLFTISPIRHLADGAHGNQISKSTLLLAVDKVISAYPDSIYIPAYEIINDDLRDYRFYDADMCHPSSVASDYIYNFIAESFFSSETKELAKQCAKFTSMMSHRSLNDAKSLTDSLVEKINLRRQELLATHPELSLPLQLYNL